MNGLKKNLVLGLGFLIISLALVTGCKEKTVEKSSAITPEEISVALVTDLANDAYDKALSEFNYKEDVKKSLEGNTLRKFWRALEDAFGSFVKINGTEITKEEEKTSVRVHCIFEEGKRDFQIIFDSDNLIINFHHLPYSGI